jgi:hypothetical protein
MSLPAAGNAGKRDISKTQTSQFCHRQNLRYQCPRVEKSCEMNSHKNYEGFDMAKIFISTGK